MKIIKHLSLDKDTQLDCFGMGKSDDIDDIYPKRLGGTGAKVNIQILSVLANKEKNNKTKGKMGDSWKFAIAKQTKGDTVFGVIYKA